jgi:hypothetical protein
MVLMIAAVATVAVVGPFGGDDASGQPPPTRMEAKAERIETQLDERPDDTKLLRATILAWVGAANDRISNSRLLGKPIPFPAVVRDSRIALALWPVFLEQTGGEASASVAENMTNAYMTLTEIGSRDPAQIEADLAGAVRASRIAGRHIHDVHTLSPAAIIAYYNGEFGQGEEIADTAVSTVEREIRPVVRQQFVDYRKYAEVFRRLLKQAKRQLRETGAARLAEPLKLYRNAAELNEDDPTR